MRASIIIPVLDIEPQLKQTVVRLSEIREALDLEILFVVDVTDPRQERRVREENDRVAEEAGGRAVYRVGERGFGSALRFGFAHARGSTMIPFMGDACDDPDDIPRLLDRVDAGWDVVAASRYMHGGGIVGNTTKQRLSRLYSSVVRLAGGPPIRDVSNAFKAYRRRVIEAIPTEAVSYDISVELTVKAYLAGFSVTEIPTVWTNRELGESGFHVSKELRRYARWMFLVVRSRRSVPEKGPA